MNRDKDISILNSLIKTTLDSAMGFEDAAKDARENLAGFFTRFAQHAHAAHEFVATRTRRCDLDGGLLARRQEFANAEIGEHHFFRAARCVLAIEHDAKRLARFDAKLRRTVATVHGDDDLRG